MGEIKQHVNFSTLIGKYCILKKFTCTDITPRYLSWLNNKELMKYSEQKHHSHNEETARNYLDSFHGTNNLFLKIISKKDSEFVGTFTIYYDVTHDIADLGILIGSKNAERTGIGTDAWKTSVNWLDNKLNVRKITAGTMRSNHPMIGILNKSKFVLEATRKAQVLLNGRPEDILYYVFKK